MRAIRYAVYLVVVAAALVTAQSQIPASYKDLKYPAMNPIKVPPVGKHTLANGITLFLVEDKELPRVQAQAVLRTGERWEPAAKASLAEITLRVLRTGGTRTRNGDALDRELDRMAASVESSAGQSSSNASMFVLKKDVDHGLTILADMLQNPAFPEDKIELAKIEVKEGIARRNDEPDGIHSRELVRLLYGKDSPYARQAEYETIAAISRDDLVAFHKDYFQPENVILGVFGDFDAAEMKAKVEKAFGGWAKGGKPKPPVPPVGPDGGKPGMYLIDKEDLTQSTLSVAFPLGRIDDPDYPSLVVMTSVLGGGFGSRMMNSIRSVEGLAYMAFAHYPAAYDRPGYWLAKTGTKSETTIKALELMKREIAKMKEAEPADNEIARAKDNILKGEAFDFDSTGKIVGRLMLYEYYGYPSDFLQRYRAGIDKVTKADVLRVAKKYLDESKFQVLVLGKQSAFEKPLTALGKVAEVDIAIPGPKMAAAPAATAETADKGKALLAKAREAHGGAALGKITAYTVTGTLKVQGPQGEVALDREATIAVPGKMRMKLVTPGGEILQVFDGQSFWIKTPQGVMDGPPPMLEQVKQSMLREPVRLLTSFDKGGYELSAMGATQLDGKAVEGLAVKIPASNSEFQLFLDPATSVIVGARYVGSMGGGPPTELTEIYSDHRDVEGVKMAGRAVVLAGGTRQAEIVSTGVKLNPVLPEGTFSKPQ